MGPILSYAQIRQGKYLKKINTKLGWEFSYENHEIWPTGVFLCAELISGWCQAEKKRLKFSKWRQIQDGDRMATILKTMLF